MAIEDAIKTIPAGPVDKPVGEWSGLQLMNENTRLALMRVREVLLRPIRDDQDPKEIRRAELGRGLLKDAVRLQVAALQNQGVERLVEYEAAEAAYEKELLTRPKETKKKAADRTETC